MQIIAIATKPNKQNSDLVAITNLINNRFNQLDRKLDATKAELKQDISDVKGEIKALQAEVKGIDKRLSNVEAFATKIPEITEKFPQGYRYAYGELKNWRQTAFVIIAGVVSAFLGWVARSVRV